MEKRAWFAEWFDTSYYHILYKNRDEEEAERFIKRLHEILKLPKNAQVLDLACGKGRHALMLNRAGYCVTGVDLSENSIEEARKLSNESLSFSVQDMREAIPNVQFDAVCNLFTSFGYFDDLSDNQKVVQAVHTMLHDQGVFVIDFMNAKRVINSLVLAETKEVDGITFHIERNFDGTHIFKKIAFEADGHSFNFTERVQALTKDDFEQLLTNNGFQILHTFGDFELNPYHEQESDRLILIAQRN